MHGWDCNLGLLNVCVCVCVNRILLCLQKVGQNTKLKLLNNTGIIQNVLTSFLPLSVFCCEAFMPINLYANTINYQFRLNGVALTFWSSVGEVHSSHLNEDFRGLPQSQPNSG